MASSASLSSHAVRTGDLVDLVSSSSSATIYPNDDAILAVLNTRFRANLPYARIGATNLVVVNPYKTLSNVNDSTAREYEERCYKETPQGGAGGSAASPMANRVLQPHVYEMAAQIYLLMRRRGESQAVVSRGITGSGKSSTNRLLVDQLLRLSAHSKKEQRIASQIKSFETLLDAFGNAKTAQNPNASRHTRYLELHFTDKGRIDAAKVLAFALDKSRVGRLAHEERSFHIFYQLLAGATAGERDHFGLEDPSDYALLASSGCYRLPYGPFSDDAIALEDVRDAMRTLGFKTKHVNAIFTLLVAILLLSNVQFTEADHSDVAAYVANPHVLEQAARFLGVQSEDLTQVLTNKTNYVRKEVYTVLLNVEQSAVQRDSFIRDLYAILFAYVVETANHKLAPSNRDQGAEQQSRPSLSLSLSGAGGVGHGRATQIAILDQPGFQTRGAAGTHSMVFSGTAPLLSHLGQNAFDEFCINFADETVQSYVLRHTFEDAVGYNAHVTGDGVSLPAVATMDNGACVELLRGASLSERASKKPGGVVGVLGKAGSAYRSGKSGERKDDDLLQDLVGKFGVHGSFIAAPHAGDAAMSDRHTFAINHYAGQVAYDVRQFIEKDADLVDAAFVTLLRASQDAFVSKLVSGPSLAAERHSKDEGIIVQAQVSSRPLRAPSSLAQATAGLAEAEHPRLDPAKIYGVSTQVNHALSEVLLGAMDQVPGSKMWTVSCIRPNDSGSANSFDKRRVKAQVRALLLPDIVARRSVEYVAEYEHATFCARYVGPRAQGTEEEKIKALCAQNGWREGTEYAVGLRCVWLSYGAWKALEDGVRAAEKSMRGTWEDESDSEEAGGRDDTTEYTGTGHGDVGMGAPRGGPFMDESRDNLLLARTGTNGTGYQDPNDQYAHQGLPSPSPGQVPAYTDNDDGWGASDWDKKTPGGPGGGPPGAGTMNFTTKELTAANTNTVEELPTTRSRKYWLLLVRLSTWWLPGFLLHHVGRMKRPDVQLAWREKLTLCLIIFLLNAVIIFYIIEFGRLLCPNFDKAWSAGEVAQHTGDNDWWAAVNGGVYDLTNFIHGQHSDIQGISSNSKANLDVLAGQDLTGYFPPPLALACQGLVTQPTLQLTSKNFTATVPQAMHNSGSTQSSQGTALDNSDWYSATFLPKMKNYYKGPLVVDKGAVWSEAQSQDNPRIWAIYNQMIFDLTDYVNTVQINQGATSMYQFLDKNIVSVFQEQAGQDITKPLNAVLGGLDSATRESNMDCISNAFTVGQVDFRKSARCQVQNYLLLVFTSILCGSIVLKFFSALQLGGKQSPEMQDKFILCQIPCYTEGEDSLRRTIDSLAALNYDDKRKLLFLICDGNIIGSGNDRTTPRICLDILGVDPKVDPEPLMFKSIGEGSKQLNYGKIYSGLYEFEGHVVPYMVVVKVGKPTERSRPGNRGKRDSQILLMHYLNRVHFDAPMYPLELEIYHQMRNVIGIDPAFYEYIFTVDADTIVTPESLNRLVAATADDSKIIGICGETKLFNPEGSWWTMIQVYEYYISHHLSKAFESLFGSVTCLPGCFSLYRIRTADKGRPVIISNRIIDEYAENHVDTLHKKNLFSLGEDRFLTTLLLKHFPTFKTKFIPHAVSHTTAPESFRVLLSQRRRWINSTIHNLVELLVLPELCGFCCFSMRFFVFIDLLGTIILPATLCYLVYLIVVVATGQAALPVISIIMIGITYGLQAIIFIIKREFMLVGWLVVYLLSYPVYAFFLPVYSFWCMDDFSWGNTRVVIGDGGNKKVIMAEDERFDESMIPLKKFSEYEAEAWEHGSHHSDGTGYPHTMSQPQFPRSRPESPSSYNQHGGDYYRDTNLTANNASNPNIARSKGVPSMYSGSRAGSMYDGRQPAMSQFLPQMPFNPFAGVGLGAGSITGGSEYGGHNGMPFPAPLGYQQTGSVYGMMPQDPRATMMTNMNMFSGSASQLGVPVMGAGMGGEGGGARPMSTFSMATTVNPFAGPNMNENPTDDELFLALRIYLSTQDLMTVTKKTAREAIAAKFPKADLAARKDFLNESIDKILSQS
ncbi:glycosyltransferase family 2 protein [Coniophora puteana RWD-64-598 SS2]|uniref:chitin synthase n=1 Tax=Coniophora puteana (strain RWD-64-598) TaxID=741705 RepID=A0A5M3MCV8_CONPW|nr:glycosyltransferase family 2 protein [Coniophora puteana RWD-64-598 SS2]EIW76465.1 glycosyltransferase family 2 protein [Coniophora puteana RWD-64-598 SS2]